MKKITLALFALGAFSTLFITSCKKDHSVSCADRTTKVSNAASAYGSAQTTENCKAYKSALQDYLNSSCTTGLTADEKQAFQDEVDALTCP